MKFQSKSRNEIEAETLLPKGVYDFQVVKAEEGTSKKGNPMIKVCLRVFAPNGGTPFVWDYLLEAFLGKLLNFCEATGHMDDYNRGELNAELIDGACGKVEIDVEPAGQYKAKNVVVDYVVAGGKKPNVPANAPSYREEMDDSDIPF